MSSNNANLPPGLPLPTAGLWTKLIADAIEVGLSEAEREAPAVRDALSYLNENRTAHRVLAGITASKNSWDETVNHLESLILGPAWMPLHGNDRESIGPMLREAFVRWEHFAASTTICPNLDGALTRAGLRSMIVLFGVFMGVSSGLHKGSAVQFKPWRSKEGLGLMLDSLRRKIHPPMTREELCEELGMSTGTWDRLHSGIVPAKAAFDFERFSSLTAEKGEDRQDMEFSLRRAFAGARLVHSMEKTVPVGPGAEEFWKDCWAEFERVYIIAAAHSAASGAMLSSLRAIFPLIAKGATGHWSHVWRAAQGDDRHLSGRICAILIALSSWNRGKSPESHIPVTDAVVLSLLDLSRNSPVVQTFLQACDASGSPEAMRLLQSLPASAQAQGMLASEYLRQGKLEEARSAYEVGFAATPNEWLVRYQLAWFESCHGYPKRALELLADPNLSVHHEYHAVQGKAHFELGDHVQALAAFEESILRKDSLLMSYELAARCARALGDVATARVYEKNWRRLGAPMPDQGTG